MIDVINFKGKDYPLFQASGFAARFAFPFAHEVCKGIGFDIGCNRIEWSLKGSIPIDITIKDEWDAMKLPDMFVDYIFSSHCLEHLPNWIEALDYWAKHLKEKATLFLYLPHRSQEYWLPMNNRKHIHFFDEEIMKQYFYNSNLFTNVFISGPDLNNSFYVIAERINNL